MKEDISVIFNCYKRPHALKMQYNAIGNQTLQPKNIFIWQNKGNYNNFKENCKNASLTFWNKV